MSKHTEPRTTRWVLLLGLALSPGLACALTESEPTVNTAQSEPDSIAAPHSEPFPGSSQTPVAPESRDNNRPQELALDAERLGEEPSPESEPAPPPGRAKEARYEYRSVDAVPRGRKVKSGMPSPSSPSKLSAAGFGGVPTDFPGYQAEGYDHLPENAFIAVADDPRSTFSVDVDTASYANIRRFIDQGQLPPVDAVRIEELVNYFSYDYERPSTGPFSVTTETSACPWNDQNLLVSIGLQTQPIDQASTPPRNLVFLIDVSGSMNPANRLPLLKRSLGLLVANLRQQDRVSIVVYSGSSGMVLEPTSGAEKDKIMGALERLAAGGSTNGGAGIELAYDLAKKTFIQDGINRVILATDGDFNVGVSSRGDLIRMVEEKRKSGVHLSVLGFGMGNLKDATMEQLADKGDGNYAYIDSLQEARKVLVEEAGATLVTVAKDVKLQVEFNPANVASYRLVGYENRKLAHHEFNDDTKDAGDMGAGHSVTALYEVVPASRVNGVAPGTDELIYQERPTLKPTSGADELLTVKIRYKSPRGGASQLLSVPVRDDGARGRESADFRFTSAVAQFGMLLRKSEHRGKASYDAVIEQARGAMGQDPHGHRRAFVELVARAKKLDTRG